MKKSKQLLLGMTVLTALSGNAYAEEVLPTYDSEATVVTATKSEEKLLHTSADVTVITGKEIEQMHYKTMTDVLKTVPNVQVLNYTQNYTRNKILINGDHNVIVLLNGVRISQMSSGSLSMNYGFNLVRDMQDVARIEVLKGAASVLYGADAKGGVINIITKAPKETKSTVSIERGNFGHEAYSIKQTINKDNVSLGIYAKKTLDGKYKDGMGRTWPFSNHTDEFGVNGKILVGKDDTGSISFNYANSKTDSMYADAIYGQKILSKQDLSTLQIAYKQDLGNDWHNTLTYNRNITTDAFRMYEWRKKKKKYRDKPSDWGTDHLRTEVINDTIVKKIDDNNRLTFGVEKTSANNLLQADQSDAVSKAFFSQYDWDFTKNWNLLLGYRRDKFKMANGKEYKANNSKSFTLTHDFDDRTNMYIAYNEYFRAPSTTELFSSKVGNKNLVPETGTNKEIGINHMTKDNTLISAHFFTRHTQNATSIKSTNKNDYGWRYENSNERAHGFDINVAKQINDKWHVKAGWAHLSIVDAGNYKLGYLPSNSITAGVDYKYKKVDVGLNTRGFIGRVGDKVNYKGWPSGRYWVTDVAVNYKPTKDAKVYMKINNIFNIDYAYHTDYIWNGHKPNTWYSMPGRNIMVGMEYSF